MEAKLVNFDDLEKKPTLSAKEVDINDINNEAEEDNVNDQEDNLNDDNVNDQEDNQEGNNDDDAHNSSDSDDDSDDGQVQNQQVQEQEKQQIEINNDVVKEYLKEKFGKDIESLDSLFEEKEDTTPEGIKKLTEYLQTTGRTIEDYVALNKDWDSVGDEDIIRQYMRHKKPHLTEDEISFDLKRKFDFDSDIDDDDVIYSKKIAKKDLAYEAKQFFKSQKEKLYAPVESMGSAEIPQEAKEALDFVNKYKESLKTKEEANNLANQKFVEGTAKLFNSEFEGFKFKIGEDKETVFKPTDVEKTKKEQSNIDNFLNKFLDDKGDVKDYAEYHKALSIAMNPDQYAKFFYEQGKSEAIEDADKESKNLDLNVRKAHEERTNESGMKVRTFSGMSESDIKLRIRK